MIPFTVFTLFDVTDIGMFVGSFVIIYFVLRLVLNPKIRTSIDILSLVLLAFFVLFLSQRIVAILLHP